MKKISLAFFLIIISIFAFSQNYNNQPDSRLLSKYSNEYLETLKNNDQQSILYLNYCLDNSYLINDSFDQEKIKHLPVLKKFNKDNKQPYDSEITTDNINNFNLFEFYFERDYYKRKLYRIGTSNKVLELYSEEEVIHNYNKIYHNN